MIGDVLRELREQAGLTLADLAKKSGVSMWSIRAYELGEREPSWRSFAALACALGASLDDFRDCLLHGTAGSAAGAGKESTAKKPSRKRGRKQG